MVLLLPAEKEWSVTRRERKEDRNMDFQILYGIQSLHNPVLDKIMLGVTKVVGSYGQLWAIIGICLLLFHKTRKCGIAVLTSYVLVFLVGNVILKDLIARPRPCHLDETVQLLISRPSSFSCPSTHTAWSFAAAGAILCFQRNWGRVAAVAAVVIGFSRMYLFVHFPTDVLFGAGLGIVLGIAAGHVISGIGKNKKKKQNG